MEVINSSIKIERIEKQGKPKSLRIKNCKTYRKALSTLIGQQYKRKNKELEIYTRAILDLYNHFHPEINLEVEADAWKGRSSFKIIDMVDHIIVIKYQKMEKGDEAREVQTIIYKNEMKTLIEAISYLNKGEPIKSPVLALTFSDRAGLGHSSWSSGSKPFFSDRMWHNKYTLMLGVLDKLKMITYKGGKINVINCKIDLQQTLEDFLENC